MKWVNLMTLTLPLGLVVGCTTGTGPSPLQREVDTLKMEVADLKDNSRLGDLRGSDASEVGRLRGEMQRLIAEIQGPVGSPSLGQQLDSLNIRLERLEQKAGLDSSPPPPLPLLNQVTPPPSETVEGGSYEAGKELFDQQDYREATDQFRSYLEVNPKGTNAAAAQFYIGESLYGLKKYEEAILEYQKVMQNFPKSSQVPISLLKQGISFQSINDYSSAKLLYQKILKNFPKSYAASVAKERLKTI
ncbi:MAG: tol-pal system protein YbgF [Candidatus Adiutrix intracellularis]|nr:tol-pal system protein YbgF [Candidatus Adiutrix intracellularis]